MLCYCPYPVEGDEHPPPEEPLIAAAAPRSCFGTASPVGGGAGNLGLGCKLGVKLLSYSRLNRLNSIAFLVPVKVWKGCQ